MKQIQTIELGDGRTITLETGHLAKQADGSVVVRCGKTMLLATVVSNLEPKEGISFFPLTVEYKEKYASTGKFPGGFIKREMRPSDYEILNSRLVDRALRPLFPDGYQNETQVLITLFSSDDDVQPGSLACLAASSALAVSNVPFNGPVSEVGVARVDGKFVLNPSREISENADLDMIVAGTADNVVMVEGELNEVSEEDMLEAIKVAHQAIKQQCDAQNELAKKAGTLTKREYIAQEEDAALKDAITKQCADEIKKVANGKIANKEERKEKFKAIKEKFVKGLSEEELDEKKGLISDYYKSIEKESIRKAVLESRIRLDGRKLDEIRPISSEVDYLPSPHGSALFTRGETQSLTTVTLGNKMDQQLIDGAVISGTSKFLLHYNFPPFCTGEAKPLRGTSRREVGHGNLAHRALKSMLPEGEDSPYTVRVVSDILESNGSSSMATVCAGSMALMDAGVKMKKAVSGIAMGMISDVASGDYAILSDILGDEDHLGDMDFKVTGTKDGITACQMDIKVDGLTYDVLLQALHQAKAGRLHILGEMDKTITEPRADYKPHTPRIVKLEIAKDYIGTVIGPGGKMIQQIQKDTETTISIDEVDGIGIVEILSADGESVKRAVEWIKNLTTDPEEGEVYKGKVKSIMPFGAFVEILPGKEGLLHISEISWEHLKEVDGVLKEGDEVEVKLLQVDKKNGRLKLSRKALLPRPAKQEN